MQDGHEIPPGTLGYWGEGWGSREGLRGAQSSYPVPSCYWAVDAQCPMPGWASSSPVFLAQATQWATPLVHVCQLWHSPLPCKVLPVTETGVFGSAPGLSASPEL